MSRIGEVNECYDKRGFYNKVRERSTMCLPWQHWTKALV